MLIPVNGCILVQKVSTPTYSEMHNSNIVRQPFIFGKVIDTGDNVIISKDDVVLFRETSAIECRWKINEKVDTFYLLEAELVVAHLDKTKV